MHRGALLTTKMAPFIPAPLIYVCTGRRVHRRSKNSMTHSGLHLARNEEVFCLLVLFPVSVHSRRHVQASVCTIRTLLSLFQSMDCAIGSVCMGPLNA